MQAITRTLTGGALALSICLGLVRCSPAEVMCQEYDCQGLTLEITPEGGALADGSYEFTAKYEFYEFNWGCVVSGGATSCDQTFENQTGETAVRFSVEDASFTINILTVSETSERGPSALDLTIRRDGADALVTHLEPSYDEIRTGDLHDCPICYELSQTLTMQ
ncbi:MAG: hypothetical protein R3A51_18680 [Nannocystaceae bacterium]